MKLFPESRLGKWAVGLTTFFLLLLIAFFTCMLLGLVTFDKGHWWDITVAVSVPVEIIAFILGILAMGKSKKRQSVLVYISVIIGVCSILFLILHSLFIHD